MQRPPEILPERINICLFHGTLDMQFTQSPYNPVSSDYLAGLGFDYYAVGHFHSRSELNEKGMINPGSPEPLGFDEKGEHGVYLVELTKDAGLKRECTFIKTQQRAYYETDLNIDGIDDYSMLTGKIADLLRSYDGRNIFKINLRGRINPDFHIDVKTLEQDFVNSCFSIQFSDFTRPVYDLEALASDKTLTGVFVRKMQERINDADENEKQMLEKALYLGLEALLEGTVDISD